MMIFKCLYNLLFGVDILCCMVHLTYLTWSFNVWIIQLLCQIALHKSEHPMRAHYDKITTSNTNINEMHILDLTWQKYIFIYTSLNMWYISYFMLDISYYIWQHSLFTIHQTTFHNFHKIPHCSPNLASLWSRIRIQRSFGRIWICILEIGGTWIRI